MCVQDGPPLHVDGQLCGSYYTQVLFHVLLKRVLNHFIPSARLVYFVRYLETLALGRNFLEEYLWLYDIRHLVFDQPLEKNRVVHYTQSSHFTVLRHCFPVYELYFHMRFRVQRIL
jgi:hypothetical protein